MTKAERAAPAWRADLRRLRPRRPPPRFLRRRRPAVIAFSGLDGSGKSSQTAAAREALVRLGHEAEVVWLPITANPSVWRLSAIARQVVRWFRWAPGVRRPRPEGRGRPVVPRRARR